MTPGRITDTQTIDVYIRGGYTDNLIGGIHNLKEQNVFTVLVFHHSLRSNDQAVFLVSYIRRKIWYRIIVLSLGFLAGYAFSVAWSIVVVVFRCGGLNRSGAGIGVVVIVITDVEANFDISNLIYAVKHQGAVANGNRVIRFLTGCYIAVQITFGNHVSVDGVATVTNGICDEGQVLIRVIFDNQCQFCGIIAIGQFLCGNLDAALIHKDSLFDGSGFLELVGFNLNLRVIIARVGLRLAVGGRCAGRRIGATAFIRAAAGCQGKNKQQRQHKGYNLSHLNFLLNLV